MEEIQQIKDLIEKIEQEKSADPNTRLEKKIESLEEAIKKLTQAVEKLTNPFKIDWDKVIDKNKKREPYKVYPPLIPEKPLPWENPSPPFKPYIGDPINPLDGPWYTNNRTIR